MKNAALLIDVTRCTGCERCVEACRQEHDLGVDLPRPGQAAVTGLSSTRLATIVRLPGDHYVPDRCRHCLEPACVSACLVGAMQKTPEGAVIYDAERCMGCRYCMVACPFGVPRYTWDEAVPVIRKCTLCHHRLVDGRLPACVEACPEDALGCGPRDELLAEAHRRIAAQPGRYLRHVYGEREVGGTAVLHISDVPLDFLGWAPPGQERSLPELTRAALSTVPATFLGVGSVMATVHWVIQRRIRLTGQAAAEGQDGAQEGTDPDA